MKMWCFTILFLILNTIDQISSAESALTISYPGSSTTTYTNLSPITNSIQIPLFTKQIYLSTNLTSGTWITPDGGLVHSPNYTIQLLTLTTEGRYLFNSTYPLNVTQIFILDITATGVPFATRSTQNVYTPLSNNSFFMTDQELVCLTGPNTQVSWYYQLTSRSNRQQLDASTNTEGVSVFSTQIAIKQGFYSCDIVNKGIPESYIVGVFDATRTTGLFNGASYSYTVGIDRQDIWVVCDPKNSSYDLRDVYISLRGISCDNPIKLYTNRNTILQGQGSMDCFYRTTTDTFVSATLLFQGPPVITLTSDTTTHYSLLPPNTNSANVRVLTPNVTLQTNLRGRWMGPDGVDTVSNIALRYFTANFAGLYSFNVTNWEGNQVVAIQISISATGSNFAEYVSQDNYRLLSGNILLHTDITLVCVTSDTSKQIQWQYRPTQSTAPTNKSSSFPVDSLGLSVLSIMTSSPGYYSCKVAGLASYEVALFNPDNTIIVVPGMSYYYIRGVDPSNILLLCYIQSTVTPLSLINLKLPGVDPDNPIKLYNLNAMDATQVTCRYRTSVLYAIVLTVYDPSFTLSYNGFNTSIYSTLSPNIITLIIPLFSTQVLLSTNIEYGVWTLPDSSLVVSSHLSISNFSLETEGRYTFNTSLTWNRGSNTVFVVNIISIVVVPGMSYYYIRGVDPSNILLLCYIQSTVTPLSLINLKLPGVDPDNPIKLYNLNAMDATQVTCRYRTSVLYAIVLTVYDPSFTLSYNGFNTSIYSTLSPNIITLIIPLFSTQVLLSTNIEYGVWTLPDSSLVVSSHLSISNFSLETEGRYTFNTSLTWNRGSNTVFVVNIISIGIPFGIRDLNGMYIPQSNNTFFYEDAHLVCNTDTNTEVNWFYQSTSRSNRAFISSTLDTGIITASVVSKGFYSCDIVYKRNTRTYVAGIFDPKRTIILSSNKNYNYTIDVDSSDIWILCNTNTSNTNQNDVIITVNGISFGNPLNLYSATGSSHSGLGSITCFFGTNMLKSANLYIQGPPKITLKFNDVVHYVTRVDTVIVPLYARNFNLTANILGRWNDREETSEILIDTFSLFDRKTYFFTTQHTWNGTPQNASVVHINTSGVPITLKTGDVYNTSIVNNQILFHSVTLACTSDSINWYFFRRSNAGFQSEVETGRTGNGISTLDVNTNKQGFYSCIIQENSAAKRYTIGIFNPFTTTVAISGVSYNYTIGVDSEDTMLLCDPKNDNINFENIVWRLDSNDTNLPNPFSLYEYRDRFTEGSNGLICTEMNANDEITRNRLIVQGPTLVTVSYSDTKYMFTLSNLSSITIPLLTYDVELSINLRTGEWRRGIVDSDSKINIDLFTARQIGEYIYSFKMFDGIEREIYVEIDGAGPVIAMRNTTGYFTIENNTVGELNTELACFTTYRNADASSIKWYYQGSLNSEPQLESGSFNAELGASSMTILKEGIYTCHVPNKLQVNTIFSVWMIELTNTTMILSSEDLYRDNKLTYTKGQTLVLFYLNPSISLSSIRWTTDEVKNGDTGTIYEYFNLVDINIVFARMGSGAFIFTCFYRQSPITVVGSLDLDLKDTAYTMLTYGNALKGKFSDLNNYNFPLPQTINIPILTENIRLSCDMSLCEWLLQRNDIADISFSGTEYVIDELRIENQGLYSLRRETSEDATYSTAEFMLNVTGFIHQSIISLGHSDITDTPITIFWELENLLPENAKQIFTISYTEYGGLQTKTTTETSFNLTDLIAGQAYTIYITLSYTYTLETSNKSITFTLTQPQSGIPIAAIISPLIVIVIALLVVTIVMFVIFILYKVKKRKTNLFKTLHQDERTSPKATPKISSDDTIEAKPQDVGEKRWIGGKKLKISTVECVNIEDKSNYDIPLEDLSSAEPKYTTIDETTLVPLEGEYSPKLEQLTENEKQIYYSNLGKFFVKKTEPLGYQRVDDTTESDRYYTPMKALESKQLSKPPITTSIPDDQFTKIYKQYIETGIGDESAIGKEFNRLNLTTEQSIQDDIIEGSKHENKHKNPVEHVLPFDDNRLVLKSQHLVGNYINASFMCDYQFIATMHPTTETLADFLQMLYQTEASMVVMLASRQEKAKIIGGLSNRKAYWPKEGNSLDCDPFSVSVVSTTESNVFIRQELLLTHNVEKKNRTIVHCISAVWNEDSTASALENIIILLVRIIKQKEILPHKPIIIHCADGISKTGVLLTIYNAVQELNQRKTINIYNAVKNLRRQRMQMVPSLACYNTCYALMNEYCSIHL